jgi:pimeloyl-ACP methyl ester carboxylesterase
MEATPATQSAGPTERQITVAGLRTPLLESGPTDATEAVVFVHGNPGSSADWRDLVGRVGQFARAVAFDMPGFGQADKPRDFEHTVPGHARFLDQALTELGIDRVHLVLHDLGGPWGLEWAATHADRVASVVLINTGALVDYRWHILARIWQRRVLGELFMATTSRFAFRTLTKRGQKRKQLPPEFLDGMYANFDRDTRRAVLKHYRAEAEPGPSARRHVEALRPHDLPALVVWGDLDPYVGVELAKAQEHLFPSAPVVVIRDSGHWPFIDNPEEVASHVLPFLRERTTAPKEA